MTRLPPINLSGIKDPAIRQALQAIAERIEVGDGNRPNANKLDKVVRLRDLVDAGIATVLGAFAASGPGFSYANPGLVDFTVPPAPTNLQASGAMASIFLSWDQAPFSNYSHTEIWRAATDDIGQAALAGTAIAPVYADYAGASASFYYWIRFVSNAGVSGPFNSTAGTAGSTGTDPAYMLAVLTGQITEAQLYTTLASRINKIDLPNIGLVDLLDELSQSILDYIPDADDRYQRLLYERAVTDATVEVDPVTGEIRLKAIADVTTDIEARLNTVEFDLNAAEASITSNAQSIVIIDDRVTVNETEIEQLADEIALKATSAYVDYKTEEVASLIDEEAMEAVQQDVPDALLWLAILGDEARNVNLINKARLATAEFTLETHTDELAAEAQARLALAAIVDDNAAAILAEQTARADADSAMASDIATLQTTVGEHTASIQTQQASIDGIHLQYTMKFDNNGFMSGFGLASSPVDGTPFSQFQFMADRFAVINPNTTPLEVTITSDGTTATIDSGETPHGRATGDVVVNTGAAQPEYNGTHTVTVTSPTTLTFPVSGAPASPATVQEGFSAIKMGSAAVPFIIQDGKVYMDTALIKDASITSAQIASLAADKIAAGQIDVALTLTAASILGGNLNINNKFTVDENGNVVIVSAATGARLEVRSNVIKVFDENGTKRVQIGDLTA